jgi:hypothetical protein
VKKTCEWKHYKIQSFFQKEGEDYDKACSSKPNIPFEVSMDWNLHVKEFSSQIKQVRKKLIPERDPCM